MEENNIGNQQSVHPEEKMQQGQIQESTSHTSSDETPLAESQSEGRILQDESLQEPYSQEEDIHTRTTQDVLETVTPQQAEQEQEAPKGALYLTARILSSLFSPFWTPLLGFVLLFFFTYLSIMPMSYKLTVLSLVFCFTVLLPIIGIFFYQKVNGWGIKELGERKKRFIPYLLTIMSYVGGLLTMYRVHFPRYMSGILLAALICMILCALVNIKWKISTHTASIGMMVGGLLSYSFLFQFNPINALYIFILLSGMLGSARIIVRQHTLNEVVGGFFIGLFCGIIGILFI